MRTVFTNDMVAHVFAQQSQSYGRSGSMRFDGDRAYSYAALVARIVTAPDGHKVMLVTSRKYSPTTSAHCSLYARAFAGETFYVPSLDADHADNLAHLREQHEKLKLRLRRMRSEPYDIRGSLAWTGNPLTHYASVFGFPVTVDMKQEELEINAFREARRIRLDTPANRAKRERAAVRRTEREEEKRLALIEQRRLALLVSEDKRQAWIRGEGVHLGYGESMDAAGSALLRLKNPDTVETSRGAEVPVTDARRVFDFVRRLRESGRTYAGLRSDGEHAVRVGHFTLNAMSADGALHIGCHLLTWEEVHRFALAQGWTSEPAREGLA